VVYQGLEIDVVFEIDQVGGPSLCASTFSRTELFANRTKSSTGPLLVWLARSLNCFWNCEPSLEGSVRPADSFFLNKPNRQRPYQTFGSVREKVDAHTVA
jgi:hypothetical protein